MPKFTIEHTTDKNSTETFAKVKEFLGRDNDIKKLDSKLQCSFDDQKKTANLKGSQFSAQVNVTEQAGEGSKVALNIEIPFLLSPFKGKIEEMLKKNLTKLL